MPGDDLGRILQELQITLMFRRAVRQPLPGQLSSPFHRRIFHELHELEEGSLLSGFGPQHAGIFEGVGNPEQQISDGHLP